MLLTIQRENTERSSEDQPEVLQTSKFCEVNLLNGVVHLLIADLLEQLNDASIHLGGLGLGFKGAFQHGLVIGGVHDGVSVTLWTGTPPSFTTARRTTSAWAKDSVASSLNIGSSWSRWIP